MALFCRILGCGALEMWSGHGGEPVFVWPDEHFYLATAREYAQTPVNELLNSQEIREGTPTRVTAFMSLYLRILGGDALWGRLVGAIVSALTAGLIVLSCQKLCSAQALPWCALISCCGPQLVMLSVTWTKEAWCVLGAAICLYGMIRMMKSTDVFPGLVVCLLGCGVLLLFRPQFGLILFTGCLMCLVANQTKSIALAVLGTFFVMGILLVFKPGIGEEMTEQAKLHVQYYSQGMQSESAMFTWANQASGPLRLIHPLLLFLNPPPKNLYKLCIRGSDWICEFVRNTIPIQWWAAAPWFALGLVSLRKENRGAMAVFASYIACWIVAAVLHNGVNPEAARYRDSLLPFAIVLVGFGIDRFLKDRSGQSRGRVRLIYGMAIALGLVLAVRDFGRNEEWRPPDESFEEMHQ